MPDTKRGKTNDPLPQAVSAGFFAFRTPLLAWEELARWGEGLRAAGAVDDPGSLEQLLKADRGLLRSRLKDIIQRKEVREALFVASPSLEESSGAWFRDPDSERGQKVERSFVRYFVRMAGRSTPFGLFAGCSVGTIGDQTNLWVDQRATYQRHTRLDMDYLFALTESLGRDADMRRALKYRPNTSLYRAAGRMRYAEARLDGKVRSYHLVAVEPADYLVTALGAARHGAIPSDVVSALTRDYEDVTPEEVEEFVRELIDSQLLCAELAPQVTGPEPIHGLIAQLREHPSAASIVGRLEQVRDALAEIDSAGLGADPQKYRDIAKALEELPPTVELPRLFQVDMVKPAPGAILGQEVLDELLRTVSVLHRLSRSRGDDGLDRFREAFLGRYENREVPLVEALDEESGIGFDASRAPSAEASPLLEGLAFPPSTESESTGWSPRLSFLLRMLEEVARSGAHEIVLEPSDLEPFQSEPQLPLPDTFSIMAAIAAPSREAVAKGEFRVLFNGASGPSGANLLGRFCHADAVLEGLVRELVRAEEAQRPDAIFAEIVHLPEGRIGNILCRPVLRDYELVYLGRSGAAAEKQVPVSDLMVSVNGRRIVLRSASLGKEVIPRLTSAHNYALRSLGMYRFLCSLQRQGVTPGLGWDWGILEAADFLPRVVLGRVVLAPARWRIAGKKLKDWAQAAPTTRFSLVQAARKDMRLPRFVAVADGDNVLPVDLDNVLSVETFINLVKERSEVKLTEVYPDPDNLCAQGPEGHFFHELVIPFVKSAPAETAQRPANVSAPGETSTPRALVPTASGPHVQRSFPPGSDWLYFKLYTGTATADQVLREVVAPVVESAMASGAADRWFFIRYGDPEWHLRVRFHGNPERLRATVEPMMAEAAAPLRADGRIWRVQLDTYEREVERYGGPVGIDLAERLFHVDSEATLSIVETLAGDEGSDARWRLVLRGMDMLLSDLGLDLDGKLEIMRSARQEFGAEFRANLMFEKQLGDKFRKERLNLEGLLDRAQDEKSLLAPGFAALTARSARLTDITEELRRSVNEGRLGTTLRGLAGSYVHMHANRLLRAAARAQELVIYDFLGRLYEGRRARARKSTFPV